jgi:hypothetical protein
MARVSAKARAVATLDAVTEAAVAFLAAKAAEGAAKKDQAEPKKVLVDYLENDIEEDEKGHKTWALPLPLSGFVSLQYQRKVKRVPNEDAADAIIKKRKRLTEEDLYTYVRVLDEEKVFSALYEGKLTAPEVEEIFAEEISYALVPQKA